MLCDLRLYQIKYQSQKPSRTTIKGTLHSRQSVVFSKTVLKKRSTPTYYGLLYPTTVIMIAQKASSMVICCDELRTRTFLARREANLLVNKKSLLEKSTFFGYWPSLESLADIWGWRVKLTALIHMQARIQGGAQGAVAPLEPFGGGRE